MSNVSSFQVFHPQTSSKGKTPRSEGGSVISFKPKGGKGPDNQESDFFSRVTRDIAVIEGALSQACGDPASARKEIEQAIVYARKIESEAPASDFVLLGASSGLLAGYLEDLAADGLPRDEITEAHLGAMLFILNERMTGPSQAAPLIDALKALARTL